MALQASDEAVCDGRLPHGPRPLTAWIDTCGGSVRPHVSW